jgi:hypothetical protein
MLRRRIAVSILSVAVTACGTDNALQPPADIPAHPIASIVDGSSEGGLAGFYFRPPIIEQKPAGTGEFDGSLLDLLSVEICEWNGAACVGSLVRRITAQDPLPARLRVIEGAGYYEALWNTARDQLNPEKTYRIRVLASGGELGHADVDITPNAAAGDPHDPEQTLVVNGSTLPIGFRIEKGVGQRSGSSGGTVTLADGDVSLTLPAGALPGDVFITATPATDLPRWSSGNPGYGLGLRSRWSGVHQAGDDVHQV